MPVSEAVRRYYAERILAETGRDRAPRNFQPLPEPPTGLSTVEGCRGGGKNILEVFVRASGERVEDIRVSCGLCNPAMYAAADVTANWARGRTFEEVLSANPFDLDDLEAFWDGLGGPGRPDDAREKFQYAIFAVQNAVRSCRGEAPVPVPEIPAPTERDWAEEDE